MKFEAIFREEMRAIIREQLGQKDCKSVYTGSIPALASTETALAPLYSNANLMGSFEVLRIAASRYRWWLTQYPVHRHFSTIPL